jgi:LPXTG-motif cell wall-anchored protein
LPNTGDDSNILLQMWICGATLTVLGGAVLFGKRSKKLNIKSKSKNTNR